MKSKYFKIHELVPKSVLDKRGEKSWELINPLIIQTIDKLKEHFDEGTITINSWKWGGDREWSGLRTPDSSYYSSTSQHALGNAVDMIFSDYSSDDVRLFIKNNPDMFPHIKGVENGISWVHVDVRNADTIQYFNK